MPSVVVVFAIFVGIIGLYIVNKINICYFPAIFFLIKFAGGRIFSFERVRFGVAFQISVLIIIILIIIIREGKRLYIKDKIFKNILPAFMMFVVLNIGNGIIKGHYWFQVILDSYKYLEIIIFYFLFSLSWGNNKELLRGVKILSILMLFLGITEIFITARGGIGLNLIMCLFPMAIILALRGYLKHYSLIMIASILPVITSQTRTYIVGFAIGFTYMLIKLPRKDRSRIIGYTIFLGIVSIIAIVVTGSQMFSGTISRFLELSSGFESSGGYRIYDYVEAWNRFLDYPIFGNGFGYLKRTYISQMGWMDWGGFIHCLYLEILFKVGIVGVAYLVILCHFFLNPIKEAMNFYRRKDDFMFAVCCGGLASFVAWLFTYTFAPLSTIGSMFVGPLIAWIAVKNDINRRKGYKYNE